MCLWLDKIIFQVLHFCLVSCSLGEWMIGFCKVIESTAVGHKKKTIGFYGHTSLYAEDLNVSKVTINILIQNLIKRT